MLQPFEPGVCPTGILRAASRLSFRVRMSAQKSYALCPPDWRTNTESMCSAASGNHPCFRAGSPAGRSGQPHDLRVHPRRDIHPVKYAIHQPGHSTPQVIGKVYHHTSSSESDKRLDKIIDDHTARLVDSGCA